MKEPKVMELPREVRIGPSVTEDISKICKRLSLGKKGYVISDEVTHEIAGDKIVEILSESGFETDYSLISDASVAEIREKSEGSDFLLGAGGGSSIDMAKFVSFKGEKPFISVPTAASHDGIASPQVSIKGMSVQTASPLAIIADTLIIKNSPYRLTAAGCGDIISNHTAVLDWKLEREENGEPYSEYAAALSEMSANIVEDNAEVIKDCTEEGIRKIVKALISSGIAISIAGSVHPTDGSEHLFSNALDDVAPEPALHGEQCGAGSIMMMYLHEEDWKSTKEALRKVECPTNSQELGIDPEYIVEALIKAPKIEPGRSTILGNPISRKEAEKIAESTEVI